MDYFFLLYCVIQNKVHIQGDKTMKYNNHDNLSFVVGWKTYIFWFRKSQA